MSLRFLEGSYIKLFLAGATIGALVFGVPVFLFAAYNDVTLATTNAEIYVGGVTLVVASSDAVIESITVDTNDFTVTMQSGSSLIVTSADRRTITVTGGDADFNCGSSVSTVTINNITTSKTYTITPSASTCSTTSSSSSGGGGGGGGIVGSGPLSVSPQGVSTQLATTTPASTVSLVPSTPSQTSQPSSGALSVSSAFNQSLFLGMSHPDVKRLQVLLNTDSETKITENGIGSPGNESSYFGSLTQKAVQKFQVKHNIVQAGMPGFGTVGPKTRIKLQEVFEAAPAPTTVIPQTSTESSAVIVKTSPSFTRLLYGGVTHPEVKRLQTLLNSDPDTRIAEEGIGSPGNETEYFGALTERAVQKFQAKHGIVSSGTPGSTGYGWVGPATRAKLQEIFGSQQ